MSPLTIAVFSGDGIGPEITAAAVEVLTAMNTELGLGLVLREYLIGFEALRQTGSTLPAAAFDAAEAADGIILGPLSTYDYPAADAGGVNASAVFREKLELYANLRPSRALRGDGGAQDIDLVVVRENSEGFYAVRTMHAGSGEFSPDGATAFAIRKISRTASARIAEEAFSVARTRGKRRVTAIHKANVLKLTDSYFLEECRRVAVAHPQIAYEEMLVDAAAAKLVTAPEAFDVIVTTNMFGDILSNVAAAVAGGLGTAGSLNYGARHAMAQASHGSAPDIAGRNLANPTSIMLSTIQLLEWLERRHALPALGHAADRWRGALTFVLDQPHLRTADLGGPATTRQFTAHVLRAARMGETSPAPVLAEAGR